MTTSTPPNCQRYRSNFASISVRNEQELGRAMIGGKHDDVVRTRMAAGASTVSRSAIRERGAHASGEHRAIWADYRLARAGSRRLQDEWAYWNHLSTCLSE